MARARIEYQFGQLVEVEETESQEVEDVKSKFKEYGINVPLLAGKILFFIRRLLRRLFGPFQRPPCIT